MAKLHELLAVEKDLEGTFHAILKETHDTFSKKPGHFMGSNRRLQWHKDGEPAAPEENVALTSTVQEKLDYQQGHIARYLNAVLQKEATNQTAKADIVIDGKTIATELPATFLLGLETKLKQMRATYAKIPTLAPGIQWVLDADKGEGIYSRLHAEEVFKTEKTIVPQILYDATDKHPAQVEKIDEVKNVGTFIKNVWSGMMTTAEKSILLGKLDKLTRAVKQARQRANNTQVTKKSIGKELFDFINS
jgi:hypothetical protein